MALQVFSTICSNIGVSHIYPFSKNIVLKSIFYVCRYGLTIDKEKNILAN